MSHSWQHIPSFNMHFGTASCYQLSFWHHILDEYHRYLSGGSCWGYGQWIYLRRSRWRGTIHVACMSFNGYRARKRHSSNSAFGRCVQHKNRAGCGNHNGSNCARTMLMWNAARSSANPILGSSRRHVKLESMSVCLSVWGGDWWVGFILVVAICF